MWFWSNKKITYIFCVFFCGNMWILLNVLVIEELQLPLEIGEVSLTPRVPTIVERTNNAMQIDNSNINLDTLFTQLGSSIVNASTDDM